MARKSRLVLLLSLLTMLITSCNQGKNASLDNQQEPKSNEKSAQVSIIVDPPEATYEIIKKTYVDKNIQINYPQITNWSDSNKQKEINDILKSEALKVLQDYEGSEKDLTLEIQYDIKWRGPTVLSVAYSGLGNVKGTAHPNNLFYTTNVNMKQGVKLTLKDLVNIDTSFVNKVKEAAYKPVDPEVNAAKEVKEELSNYTASQLLAFMNQADIIGDENELSVFSYFTMDSLGISINVPHALGDHAEFEIKYADLIPSIKADNEAWNDFSSLLQK